MAIIPQSALFGWEQVDNLGDLQRLRLVLSAMPDEELMRTLEAHRGKGRDDYPIRAVWNSVLAGIVFQHASVESLRRELGRNGELRQMCGFDSVKDAEQAVPPSWVYTRFLHKLMAHQGEIDAMLDRLVEALREELPGFGRYLACDSKGIDSHGRPRGKEALQKLQVDGRRDLDADFGAKTYKGRRQDGTLWQRVVRWFGYKLHLVVDATYEMPVAYEVTKASRADNRSASRMIERLGVQHEELLESCEAFIADKAYDDTKLLDQLWCQSDDHVRHILPVIPKREDWRDGDQTRPLLEGAENITYDCQGQLYCWCMGTGKRRRMVYWGYDQGRGAQKWRCAAAAHGHSCQSYLRCSKQSAYGRVVWVNRQFDRRTFLPVARSSYRFARLYRKRTSVERVNSRLDVSFGFENHFIRGLGKMRVRCSLALVVMLAMAVGRERHKRKEKLRSLVSAAA